MTGMVGVSSSSRDTNFEHDTSVLPTRTLDGDEDDRRTDTRSMDWRETICL